MIIGGTNNKVLAIIGVFMIITLLIAASFMSQTTYALKSKAAACKDRNIVCDKQPTSDQQKNVPLELPFP
jgi:hypothetical protein